MTQNPYIGPRFFREEEQAYFFGRDEETHILMGLVQARRVVLLFAKSGVGKSSLLRAGLIPKLTETKTIKRGRRTHTQPTLMQVLPVTTVGGGIRAEASLSQHNPFILSLLSSLYPERSPESLAALSLAEGLTNLLDTTSDQPTLLIIDQFEELFTRHVSQWQAREPFFQQINQALTDYPGLHVLFAMREDYIAELTPYADLLSDRLQSRFRLERLNRDCALQAITNPAEQAGRSFVEGVAENLVDNLRQTQQRAPKHGPTNTQPESLSKYVEAVHLQVVCRQLWAQLPANQTVIEQSHVQAFGDVDKALTQFYEDSLQAVLQATTLSERQLRNWFSDKLITPNQTRGLVYRGESDTEGLPNEAVEFLSSHWLLRADKRGGDTWYELAHDRLVGPIVTANGQWKEQYYNPLALPTTAWLASGRNPELLQEGTSLREAQRYVEQNSSDITEDERLFLDESLRLEAQREKESQKTAQRRRRYAIVATFVIMILILLTGLALLNAKEAKSQKATAEAERATAQAAEATAVVAKNEAEAQAQLSRSRELAAESVTNLGIDPEQSILLAQQAFAVTYTVEAENALRLALQTSRIERRFVELNNEFRSVAYSPDGTRLAISSKEPVVKVWDITENSDQPELMLVDHSDEVWQVVFSPDGTKIATASLDKTAKVWDAQSGTLLQTLMGHWGGVLSVAFSPDGERLATAGLDGRVRMWDSASGNLLKPLLSGHRQGIADVAFSPDGNWIATASRDNTVKVWDSRSGDQRFTLDEFGALVHAVAFSPDGTLLATTGSNKEVLVWDVSEELPELVETLRHTDTIFDVSFSFDGRCLATTSLDRTAKLWDLADAGQLIFDLVGHTNWVYGVAFKPVQDESLAQLQTERCGTQLATAGRNGTVRLWNLGASYELNTLIGHAAPVESVVFSPDGVW